MGELHIGTFGWTYDGWRGIFYPEKMKLEEYLPFYARQFHTTEISLPQPKTFEQWATQVPEGFLFAVKASGSIKNLQRLKNIGEDWKSFLEQSKTLGPKLGPILLQFPPSLKCHADFLSEFLDQSRQLGAGKLALEFRHRSWFDPEALEVALRHRVAVVIASSERYPEAPGVPTADFVYLRFYGPGPLFSSKYSEAELEPWATRINRWLGSGRDVYAYFSNDFEGNALINARQLERMVARIRGAAASTRH